jgi:hypothetical protein
MSAARSISGRRSRTSNELGYLALIEGKAVDAPLLRRVARRETGGTG